MKFFFSLACFFMIGVGTRMGPVLLANWVYVMLFAFGCGLLYIGYKVAIMLALVPLSYMERKKNEWNSNPQDINRPFWS